MAYKSCSFRSVAHEDWAEGSGMVVSQYVPKHFCIVCGGCAQPEWQSAVPGGGSGALDVSKTGVRYSVCV